MEKVVVICMIEKDNSIIMREDPKVCWSVKEAKEFIKNLLIEQANNTPILVEDLQNSEKYLCTPAGDYEDWLDSHSTDEVLNWIVDHNNVEALASFIEALQRNTLDIRISYHVKP